MGVFHTRKTNQLKMQNCCKEVREVCMFPMSLSQNETDLETGQEVLKCHPDSKHHAPLSTPNSQS